MIGDRVAPSGRVAESHREENMHKIVFIFLTAFLVSCTRQPSPSELTALKQQGDPIVEAIKLYEQSNGKYPISLNDLVPEFMSSIPTTSYDGVQWEYYTRDGGDKFSLYCNLKDPRPTVINSGGGWLVDTK